METFSALLALCEWNHRWIPLTKASNANIGCFPWCAPKHTVGQTVKMPVIWDATLIMTLLKFEVIYRWWFIYMYVYIYVYMCVCVYSGLTHGGRYKTATSVRDTFKFIVFLFKWFGIGLAPMMTPVCVTRLQCVIQRNVHWTNHNIFFPTDKPFLRVTNPLSVQLIQVNKHLLLDWEVNQGTPSDGSFESKFSIFYFWCDKRRFILPLFLLHGVAPQ